MRVLSYDQSYDFLKRKDLQKMSFFKTNAERRRFLAFEEHKLQSRFGTSTEKLTSWDRYSIYVMNTDEAPISFDEWLDT